MGTSYALEVELLNESESPVGITEEVMEATLEAIQRKLQALVSRAREE